LTTGTTRGEQHCGRATMENFHIRLLSPLFSGRRSTKHSCVVRYFDLVNYTSDIITTTEWWIHSFIPHPLSCTVIVK